MRPHLSRPGVPEHAHVEHDPQVHVKPSKLRNAARGSTRRLLFPKTLTATTTNSTSCANIVLVTRLCIRKRNRPVADRTKSRVAATGNERQAVRLVPVRILDRDADDFGNVGAVAPASPTPETCAAVCALEDSRLGSAKYAKKEAAMLLPSLQGA